MKKKAILLLVALTTTISATACGSSTIGLSYNSSETCCLCGDTPTHHFEEDAYDFYLCKDCTTHCEYCGASGATMYEDYLFSEIKILCKECYEEEVEIGGFQLREW